MDISFNCNNCGQHILIDAAGAGLSVKCPKCNNALVVPREAQPPIPVRASTEHTKQCPFCAETIKKEATVCRFCGRNLEQPARSETGSRHELSNSPPSPRSSSWEQESETSGLGTKIVLLVCVAALGLGAWYWFGMRPSGRYVARLEDPLIMQSVGHALTYEVDFRPDGTCFWKEAFDDHPSKCEWRLRGRTIQIIKNGEIKEQLLWDGKDMIPVDKRNCRYLKQ